MRVTKKRAGKPVVLSGLDLIAHFLNFDFRSGDLRELRELFMSSLVFQRFPARQKAESLQSLLKRDLLPIIAPSMTPEPVEAYRVMERLVTKINKMNLKLKWAVEPVDYDFVDATVDPRTGQPTGRGIELVGIARDEAKWKLRRYLAPGQRPLKALGARWIVSERVGLTETRDLEDYFYWAIINAMQHGEFSRLKMCGGCQRFFVQSDVRQEFCGDKCRTSFNNKRRLESGYFTELRAKKRERALAKARSLLKEGKPPGEVARQTRLSLRLLKREGLLP